jgi:hypothetical protein
MQYFLVGFHGGCVVYGKSCNACHLVRFEPRRLAICNDEPLASALGATGSDDMRSPGTQIFLFLAHPVMPCQTRPTGWDKKLDQSLRVTFISFLHNRHLMLLAVVVSVRRLDIVCLPLAANAVSPSSRKSRNTFPPRSPFWHALVDASGPQCPIAGV